MDGPGHGLEVPLDAGHHPGVPGGQAGPHQLPLLHWVLTILWHSKTLYKDDIVCHLLKQRHLPPESVVPAPGEAGPEAGGQAPHPLLALPGLSPRHASVVDEGKVVALPEQHRVFIQTWINLHESSFTALVSWALHTSSEESSRAKKCFITFDLIFWCYLPSRSIFWGSRK